VKNKNISDRGINAIGAILAVFILVYWIVSYIHIIHSFYYTAITQRVTKDMFKVADVLSRGNIDAGIYVSDELGAPEFYRSMMFGYLLRANKLYYSDSWYSGGYFNSLVKGSAIKNADKLSLVLESTEGKVISTQGCAPFYRDSSFRVISIKECGYIIPKSDVHMPENDFRWLGRQPEFLIVSSSPVFVNIELVGVFPGARHENSKTLKLIYDKISYQVAISGGRASFSIPTGNGNLHDLTFVPDYEVTSPSVLYGNQDNRILSYRLGHMSISKDALYSLANRVD
jgi:hypothetical protein